MLLTGADLHHSVNAHRMSWQPTIRRLLVIMTAAEQVVTERVLVAPGGASVRDEHYGGPRPAAAWRAVRPRTAAKNEFCALGPVAEVFITGAAAAGHTRLGPELAELNTLRAAHGERAFAAALDRTVAFSRWRAADVRSILSAGAGVPGPAAERGEALVLDSPVVPVRPLAAPTPGQPARFNRTQLRALLKKAGPKNTIDAEVERLHTTLRAPQLRQLPLVEQAMGWQALALLRQLDAACASADDLAKASIHALTAHPDAEIITRFPGLGSLSGAPVLAELGEDRSRFADAKGLKAYAGAALITRASGKNMTVTARRINLRLAATGYMWGLHGAIPLTRHRVVPPVPCTTKLRSGWTEIKLVDWQESKYQ